MTSPLSPDEPSGPLRHRPAFPIRVIRAIEAALYSTGLAVPAARLLGFRPGLRTTSHEVRGPSTRPATPSLRVGYASDFHAGPTTDPKVLEAACAALQAAEPDVVLYGGDYVNFRREEVDALAPALGAVPAPLGRYAVLGNHDWVAGPEYITRRLEQAGITLLTNRNVRLPPPFGQVWICGLDDHWCGRPNAGSAFAGADGYRIVLMHAPSGLLDIGEHRFDLALCGHTHGGQIALPGGRPVLLPNGDLSRRYHRGRHELAGGGTLVVSLGVGCALLPIRVHADPEILVCTLTWPEQAAAERP